MRNDPVESCVACASDACQKNGPAEPGPNAEERSAADSAPVSAAITGGGGRTRRGENY